MPQKTGRIRWEDMSKVQRRARLGALNAVWAAWETSMEVKDLRDDLTALLAREARSRSSQLPDVLTLPEAALYLGMAEAVLLRKAKRGEVPHAKVFGPRGYRFVKASLAKWLRRGCPRARGGRT